MRLPEYPIQDEPVRAAWGRLLVDYLRSITPRSSPGMLVSTTANGSTFQPDIPNRPVEGGAGLDMSHIDFGYVITDATLRTVNFNPGVFRHSQQHFTVLGATAVVISTSPAYIYVAYTRGSAPILMPPTHDLNATIPATTTYRHLLYTFTITSSGGLEDPTIHHLGGIFIGAYWA